MIEVCRRAKPGIGVKRARFSALVHNDLVRALNHLVPPNENDAKAVDARQEIDLRIGASFTRFQTLLLQVLCKMLLTQPLTDSLAAPACSS